MATKMIVENSKNEESINESENKGEEESWCPLFSEGLPSDFASNSKLAAIASLLNDDSSDGHSHSSLPGDENEKKNVVHHAPRMPQGATRTIHNRKTTVTPMTAAGGGKAKRHKRRQRKSGTPYDKENHSSAKTASVGEAQLFLNLWKI